MSGNLLEERLGRNGGCEGTGRRISLVSLWGDVEGMFFFLLFFFLGEGMGMGMGIGGGVDFFFLFFSWFRNWNDV